MCNLLHELLFDLLCEVLSQFQEEGKMMFLPVKQKNPTFTIICQPFSFI